MQTLNAEETSRSASNQGGTATLTREVAPDAQSRLMEAMKSQYSVAQQVKFLHLQAEAESLFQQLKVMQQRQGNHN